MASFAMTCTCGDVMSVEAPDRDTAVTRLKAMMDEEGVKRHMETRHSPSDPRPSVEQVHSMIEQMLAPA